MIRRAEISDAEAIADCHRQAILAVDRQFYDDAQIAAWAAGTIPSKYLDSISKGELFVVEEASGIGAFGWLKTSPAEIRAIYVLPSHQGKGYGSKLLEFLESKLLTLGVKEIMLGASLNAHAFYARHGYCAGSSGTLEMSGVSIPYNLMNKQLG